MEKVTKVPSEITPKGTPDQYGNQAYLIKFTDNTTGFFRTPKQDLFFLGQPAEFEIGQVAKKDGTGMYTKIQRVQKEGFQKNFKGSTPEEKNRAFALSYAKDITVARLSQQGYEFDEMEIFALAESFNQWLNNKPHEDSKVNTEDDLPF